jgi:uncharacterized membrane protein YraQ (UPF0718 family)
MKSATRELSSFPLRPWSVLAAFAFDWLLFTVNLLTELHALAGVILVGSLICGLTVGLIERLVARASWPASLVRAALVTVLVASPLPVLGTALATLALSFALSGAFGRTVGPAGAHPHSRRGVTA